jgi:prevent-host-death family protein
MLTKADTWKLQDAKARFSEVVRRAKAGEPQRVTLHGQEAVVVVDPARFEITPKPEKLRTMREFIEGSKKYRGLAEGIDFEPYIPMNIEKRKPVDFEDDT